MKKLIFFIITLTSVFNQGCMSTNHNYHAIAGGILLSAGISSALLSKKLIHDYQKEGKKLRRIFSSSYGSLTCQNYSQRERSNLIKLALSTVTGFAAFCMVPVGAYLLGSELFTRN